MAASDWPACGRGVSRRKQAADRAGSRWRRRGAAFGKRGELHLWRPRDRSRDRRAAPPPRSGRARRPRCISRRRSDGKFREWPGCIPSARATGARPTRMPTRRTGSRKQLARGSRVESRRERTAGRAHPGPPPVRLPTGTGAHDPWTGSARGRRRSSVEPRGAVRAPGAACP